MTTPTPPDPYSAATSTASSGANSSIIPGSALGASLMTLNTTTLNASSVQPGGVFGYEGVPTVGNLLYCMAPAPGADVYGNTHPAGVVINAGQLNGVNLVGVGMDATSTLTGSIIAGGVMSTPAISGGTAVSTLHVLNSSGGAVLSYSNSGNNATFSTNGTYSWTAPTNVTQVKVECWGAGAGGGGGSGVQGGEGGGGGEYAAEPTLTVVPGQVYQVTVGQGGKGGSTNTSGNSGSASIFADQLGNNLVYANGGQAGLSFQGGSGGVGSTNTIEEPGGTGATASGNTGGNGGGSSGGSSAPGNAGTSSSSSTGGAGGGAPTGGGAGGAGGNTASNGVNGSSPGGAGGGAGNGSSSASFTKTYRCSGSVSYWGATAHYGQGPYSFRSANGSIYQMYPGPGQTGAGDQYGFALFNYRQMQSDLAGATINSIYLQLTNLGSWYSNGSYIALGYTTYTGQFGNFFQPGAGTNEGLAVVWQNEGATTTYDVTSWLATHLAVDFTAIAIGPASSVGQSGNLSYYGYWFGYAASDNRTPQIIVNYTAGAGSTELAGNGADGQVKISYNGSNSLVGAFTPSGGTDAFGNPYNAGSTTVQHTFITGSLPAASSIGGIIAADVNGTPSVVTPQGGGGAITSGSSDTTQITVTATSFQNLTNAYGIPANDAKVGTSYRLTATGFGNQNASNASQLQTQISLTGSGFGSSTMGGGVLPANHGFRWKMDMIITIISIGSGGTFSGGYTFTLTDATTSPITTSTTETWAGRVTAGAINTTTSNTLALQFAWVTNAGSVTCHQSTFERISS